MEYRIRQARGEDSPEAVRVVKAVYDEYGFTWDPDKYHADLYDLAGHYLDRGTPFWLAEGLDGAALGVVALELFEPIPGPAMTVVEHGWNSRVAGADCSMERLYVHPGARRLGVGRTLACAALAEARARGRTLMELWSDKRFTKAHALYQSMGARIVGERICHDPDQSPEWGLALPIEP